MPATKNPYLRHRILDECFRNSYRKYYIEDLLETVNQKLESQGFPQIALRQLKQDITDMENIYGILREDLRQKEGQRKFFRYKDRKFSITKQPLTEYEKENISLVMDMLSRAAGTDAFIEVSDAWTQLKDKFGYSGGKTDAICFQGNEYLTGKEYIKPLFDAIQGSQVLNVSYKPYEESPFEIQFHPYYLKQFNNRWFIFGQAKRSGEDHAIWNLALDRIQSISEGDPMEKYIPTKIDWNSYFDDIIGVSVPRNEEKVEEVKLKFSPIRYKYVKTKPLHPTQKWDDENHTIRIKVIPTRELMAQLLYYGKDVEVLQPTDLREQIAENLREAVAQYGM